MFLRDIRGVGWDWGDTLMRDIPGQEGPMADWPRVEAMPGASDALSALSADTVQCVATNAADSNRARVAEAFDRVGLRDHLTHFFTSSELGTSKPDPGFFEEVARELGTPPTSLMAVGNDFHKDIVPAKAVGMVTVLVSSEAMPTPQGTADFIVPDLFHLAELFRDWSDGLAGDQFPEIR